MHVNNTVNQKLMTNTAIVGPSGTNGDISTTAGSEVLLTSFFNLSLTPTTGGPVEESEYSTKNLVAIYTNVAVSHCVHGVFHAHYSVSDYSSNLTEMYYI